jgi:hypothetical protein
MPAITSFIAYRLDIEWLLTWFPIQANAAINEQKTRVGTIHYISTDEPFASGNSMIHLLGQGPQIPFTYGDPLSPNNVAVGFITVGVNQEDLFALTIEARLGSANAIKSLLAPPNTRLPFMVNLFRPADQRELYGPALSLHGTITTGKRPADLVTDLLKP